MTKPHNYIKGKGEVGRRGIRLEESTEARVGKALARCFECDNVEVVSPDIAQGGPFFSDVESHTPLSGSSLVCFLHHPSVSLLPLCPNSHYPPTLKSE